MGFGEAVKTCFGKKYVDFHGRASRSEYWYFVLAMVLIIFVMVFICAFNKLVLLVGEILTVLALILPLLAVQVRRMHDTNASGWWSLLGFIPYVGNLIWLVWGCIPGTKGENRFGPDPLNPHNAEAFD